MNGSADNEDGSLLAAVATAAYRRDLALLLLLIAIGTALTVVEGGAIALMLFLISIGVAVVSPYASVAAVAVATPFIYHPVELQGGQWSPLELAIVVSTVSIGGHVVIHLVRTRSMWITLSLAKPFSTFAAAILLVLVGAVSLLTVADTRYLSDSVREFRWVIVEPVIAFLLFRWAFRDPRARLLVLTGFV